MNAPMSKLATTPRICHAEHLPGTVAQDAHVPVLIVGGGARGLTAALMLYDAGVDCAVLERDATPLGSSALSSGFIPAPGTLAQCAAGIDDSPERFAADISAKAKGRAAPHLVQAYAQAIGPALDALQARHGLQWQVLDGFLYPGHSVRRMHATPEKTGVGLMGRLANAVTAVDIPLITEATVRELWVNAQQRVIGVGYERPDGTLEHLACDALILACNGFGGNPAMVRELLPEMRDALFAGHTGNDGSAIRAGWTSTPSAACSGSTASDCPICWPQAAPRGACLATRSGAISPATACSAPWPVATSPRTRPLI